MLKEAEANEELKPESVIITIAGEPGMGKTSLGFTGENPYLIDFDRGAYRSAFRKKTGIPEEWADVSGITPRLKPYNPIVIDTGGRALDMLMVSIKESNPKLANPMNGLLSQSGWGALKSQFLTWIKGIQAMGKDIIILTHDKEKQKGDDTIIHRPDITGGSYQYIFSESTAIGFLYVENGKRMLDFVPRDWHIGKDPAGIGKIEVPNYAEEPLFLDKLITHMKDTLGRISMEGKAIADAFKAWQTDITKASTTKDIEEIYSRIKTEGLAIALKKMTWEALTRKAEAVGVVYNKKEGVFVPKKGTDKATSKDLRQLFAEAKKAGMDDETLKNFCLETYSVKSRKDMTLEQINSAAEHVKTLAKQ